MPMRSMFFLSLLPSSWSTLIILKTTPLFLVWHFPRLLISIVCLSVYEDSFSQLSQDQVMRHEKKLS